MVADTVIGNESNNPEPLVSVLVQTYQHASFIVQCLDSVLEQRTSFDYEILVGEDDSKDGTRDICKEYERLNPERIRLFLHDRKNVIYINGRPTGRYNFINNLKSARGKYLAFCEGDDYWTDSDKLQKQVDFLEANADFVGCYHNVRLADDSGTLLDEWKIAPDRIAQQSSDDFMTRLKVPLLSAVIRRDAISFPPAFYKVLNADQFLTCMIGQHGKLEYLPDIKDAVAHIHQRGIWSSLDQIQKFEQRIESLNTFFDIVEPENRERLRHYIERVNVRLAKFSFRNRRFGSCFRALLNIAKLRFFKTRYAGSG